MTAKLTMRAEATDRRTYRRPILSTTDEVTGYETREQEMERCTRLHVSRLLEGVGADVGAFSPLLDRWHDIVASCQASPAGRTRWLGGTDIAFDKPECQFNCSFALCPTAEAICNLFWLELVGCGTGARPKPGTMRGLEGPANVVVLESVRGPSDKGNPDTYIEQDGQTIRLVVGDSAEGWVHALRLLMNLDKMPGATSKTTLQFDMRECRGAGGRLKGFGWICNGSEPFAKCLVAIFNLLRGKGPYPIDAIDIGRIINHLGTLLSTRRSAQNLILDSTDADAGRFSRLKAELFEPGNDELRQSNNSIMYYDSPGPAVLAGIIRDCLQGVDLGIVNRKSAMTRAPWFEGSNPCFEILLPSAGFCNLVDVNLRASKPNAFDSLVRTVETAGAVNYLQTCVDLTKSGMLDQAWHDNNHNLRLCGVGLTGIVQSTWLTDYQIMRLRHAARKGAFDMASHLGLPEPKAVTTVKPSGTLSKTMATEEWGEVAEGIHCPLGKFIFNWIAFSAHDPLVKVYKQAGMDIIEHPTDASGVLIKFPAEYKGISTFTEERGLLVNRESAIEQLNRVARYNRYWCDHNASCTLYVDENEIDELAEEIHRLWDLDLFTSLSFGWKADPLATPEDYNQKYLPQQAVTEQAFREYTGRLTEPQYDNVNEDEAYEIETEECEGGHCPVR